MYWSQAYQPLASFSLFSLSHREVCGRRASRAGKSGLEAGITARRLVTPQAVTSLPAGVILEPLTAFGHEAQVAAHGSLMSASGVTPSTDEQRGGLFSPATYGPS